MQRKVLKNATNYDYDFNVFTDFDEAIEVLESRRPLAKFKSFKDLLDFISDTNNTDVVHSINGTMMYRPDGYYVAVEEISEMSTEDFDEFIEDYYENGDGVVFEYNDVCYALVSISD